jgi:hypothetical protein
LVASDDIDIAKLIRSILIDEKQPLHVRALAAAALGGMKHGQIAAGDLAEVLKNQRENPLFTCALNSLSRLRPSKADIPLLVGILESGRSIAHFTGDALVALGQIGNDADSEAPRILAVVKRPFPLATCPNEIAFALKNIIGADRALAELAEYARWYAKAAPGADLVQEVNNSVDAIATRIKAKAK